MEHGQARLVVSMVVPHSGTFHSFPRKSEFGPSPNLFGETSGTSPNVMLQQHPLATKFESKNMLTADVPAFLVVSPGTWRTSVTNPPSLGGGRSNTIGFVVRFR